MRMVDAGQYVPTREDLEDALRDLGFVPRPVDRNLYPNVTDHDLWVFPDGTKSVLFSDKGDDSGEALYCDSDQHEPGKYINYRQIRAVATGYLALDAPELAKIPLLGPPVWASGPTPQTSKMLPAKASEAANGVVEAEFEPEPEPVPTRLPQPAEAQLVEPDDEDTAPRIRRWVIATAAAFAIALVVGAATLIVAAQLWR